MSRCSSLALVLLAAVAGCAGPRGRGPAKPIRYVGSSTVAVFLRDAEPVYRHARFLIDTEPESEGGERAAVEGTTDLAGTARTPRPATLRAGVAATHIGHDAIAVIVNEANPVSNLSLGDLRSLFSGRVKNWKELGGPDLLARPFVPGAESASRRVFRSAVLHETDYAGCSEIRPDRAIVDAVKREPGGVGPISFSFLNGLKGVRAITVDGEPASVTNLDYPIGRPLYLLWREGNPDVEAFVEWARTAQGQEVVMQHFVGVRVVGSVRPSPSGPEPRPDTGTLIVYTQTYPVDDGGILYYPHLPYEILDRYGRLIRHVANRRSINDERPARIELPPDTYLIRPHVSVGTRPELFVTVESGETTSVDVPQLLRERK